MTTENRILDITYEAAESLASDQYRWMVLDATTGKVRRPDSAAEALLGILQNAPASGGAASVRVDGISKLQMNAAAAIGKLISAEYVDAADAGKGQDAGVNWEYARGIVVEASAAEDDLAGVRLIGPFPNWTGNKVCKSTVATVATVADVTFTAAQMLGGLILRDPNGGARADLLDAAANIIAAIKQAGVANSFEFTVRNTADAAEAITITTNTGLTLSGTMTIAQNNSKRFLAVVTSGTEVTVYSLGTVVH